VRLLREAYDAAPGPQLMLFWEGLGDA